MLEDGRSRQSRQGLRELVCHIVLPIRQYLGGLGSIETEKTRRKKHDDFRLAVMGVVVVSISLACCRGLVECRAG
jgi:hypothetical protein